jgi:hypothetical protein
MLVGCMDLGPIRYWPLLLASACSFPDYNFVDPATVCTDGVRGPQETGVDCGGLCPACPAGQGCRVNVDCESGNCKDGICQNASCTDGLANGSESDVDCGGSCMRCGNNQACRDDGDCVSHACDSRTCQAPTCNDGRKNGDETGIDCGGLCATCVLGDGCLSSGDCQSQACNLSQNVCVGAGCSDQVKNGDETDVDCGGPKCAPCEAGKQCLANSDCTSLICDEKADSCVAAACTDSVQNQGETDIDCGGGRCPPCVVGKTCLGAPDCASGLCQAGLCVPTKATGTPLPRNDWQVSALSSCMYCQPPRAIDGDETTRWASNVNQYAGLWFQIDLGKPQFFFSIVIDSQLDSGDHAQQLNVYFSNTPNFDQPTRSGIIGSDVTTVAFDTPIVARYIKLELATGYTSWWSIDELNIQQ